MTDGGSVRYAGVIGVRGSEASRGGHGCGRRIPLYSVSSPAAAVRRFAITAAPAKTPRMKSRRLNILIRAVEYVIRSAIREPAALLILWLVAVPARAGEALCPAAVAAPPLSTERVEERRDRVERTGAPAVEVRLLLRRAHAGFADRVLRDIRIAVASGAGAFGRYPYPSVVVIDQPRAPTGRDRDPVR